MANHDDLITQLICDLGYDEAEKVLRIGPAGKCGNSTAERLFEWIGAKQAVEKIVEAREAWAHGDANKKAKHDLDELRKAAASLVAAVESYAQTNGWIELSEGIIGGTERLKALLPAVAPSTTQENR